MVLHLIPHLVGYILSLKNWVIYGGEFITYQKNDTAQINDIYELLKENLLWTAKYFNSNHSLRQKSFAKDRKE